MNAKRAAKAKTSTTKLFVLDTNVLMHDPLSLFRFEEHDIFVPMMTLEELDANKKGMSEVARNARQSSRLLDEIVSGAEHNIARHQRRKVNRRVGLSPRMRLNVCMIRSEQPLRPLDSQALSYIDILAPAVVPLARVSFGVLVCQRRTEGFKHRPAHEILRRN